MKETQSNETSATRKTNTSKMEEKNNIDFIRLHQNNNNNHDQSSSISTPTIEQSPLVLTNPNFSSDDNYLEYYSWMKINSRPKLWLIIGFCSIIGVSAFVLVKRYGPLFVHEEVIPVIKWLVETFPPPVLAAILFAAIALLPVLLLPSVPFKWVAGMTFGYGIGFLLIAAGEAVAVSLPYTIANHFFLRRIKRWLDNRPREAAIVRLAGDGDWFHQFRAVALIRLTPFPYVLFNYIAVVTGVKYSPYLAGSLVGMVPEIFVAIYSGILIRTVAEAMEDDTPIQKRQIVVDGIGFCLTLVASIIIGFYSKRRLKQLQEDGEQPWQQL